MDVNFRICVQVRSNLSEVTGTTSVVTGKQVPCFLTMRVDHFQDS